MNGLTLLDTARGVMLPVHRRRIGYVFQEARLFPHLTVRQNLLFGRWFRGGAGGAEFGRMLEMLGIGGFSSGGRGRCRGARRRGFALGRALMSTRSSS